MTPNHLLLISISGVIAALKFAPFVARRMTFLLQGGNGQPPVDGAMLKVEPVTVRFKMRQGPARARRGAEIAPPPKVTSRRDLGFIGKEEHANSASRLDGVVDLQGFERVQARLASYHIPRNAPGDTAPIQKTFCPKNRCSSWAGNDTID